MLINTTKLASASLKAKEAATEDYVYTFVSTASSQYTQKLEKEISGE